MSASAAPAPLIVTHDQALAACIAAEQAVSTARVVKQDKMNDLNAAETVFQALVAAENTPVAGDQECKDVQEAKIDKSLADSQLSQAELKVMKLNKQVQELARGGRSTVPTPTKPIMDGLAQGQYRKEAWTGGKPLPD